jgi:spore germination protein YaaH
MTTLPLLFSVFAASAAERPVVYGYHAYWTDDPVTLDFERLTHVAIFNVDVDVNNVLSSKSNWTNVAEDVVAAAHAKGTKVHLCVTAFSSDEHYAVFRNDSFRSQLIEQLADLVHQYGADGVNVDFEGLSSAYRDDMIDFVVDLRAEVGEVVLATPAVDWSGAWDYSELSAVSDGLFIMGYAFHYTGGNPGPNDPLYASDTWGKYGLDWSVNDYLTYEADPDKVILGLPLYGQWWDAGHTIPGSATGDAGSIPMVDAIEEAAEYGALYDDESSSPYYLPPGEQVWYPTHDSVRERIQYAIDQGLAGTGFWALDYEGRDPAFWDMVEETAAWPSGTDDSGNDDNDTAADDDSGNTPRGPGRATLVSSEPPAACSTTGGPASAWLALAAISIGCQVMRRVR